MASVAVTKSRELNFVIDLDKARTLADLAFTLHNTTGATIAIDFTDCSDWITGPTSATDDQTVTMTMKIKSNALLDRPSSIRPKRISGNIVCTSAGYDTLTLPVNIQLRMGGPPRVGRRG